MRRIHAFALAIALVASSGIMAPRARSGTAPTARYLRRQPATMRRPTSRCSRPAWCSARGCPTSLPPSAKETSKTVGINTVGMGTIVDEIGKRTPPPDMIVLPFQLMNSLALEGGVVPGTMVPLGRNRMGLAVKAGAPKPDISTPEKFIAALKTRRR